MRRALLCVVPSRCSSCTPPRKRSRPARSGFTLLIAFATCQTAHTISVANRQTGTTPPAGRTLHHDCPK
jgi:hypothetical protein